MTLQRAQQVQDQVQDQLHGGSVVPLRPASNWLRGVQIPELARYWPVAEPLLARLPHLDLYTLPSLRASVESGKRWLWLSEPDRACAMLTQITEYPRADVLVIFAIAGRLPRNWRAMLATLEDHARSIGCSQVEVWGRKGWARKLPGYEPGQIVLRKNLDGR